jgi:hypothetical protein
VLLELKDLKVHRVKRELLVHKDLVVLPAQPDLKAQLVTMV